MPRVLLLLPTTTYRAADFLAAAGELRAEVVVATDARQTLAEVMGERALEVDFSDLEGACGAIVELAERLTLDAIVGVDDRGVMVAALAAGQLGLRHNPPESVLATRDKALLRRLLADGGVPQPAFALAGPDDDVGGVATEIGFPCVVKPTRLSGSRGVIRADGPEEARAAGRRARSIAADVLPDELRVDRATPLDELLVEQYMPGAEVSLEGLLRSGELSVLAVFDKPDPLEGPYFEETIYVTPSRLPSAVLDRVAAVAAAAAAAIGLVEGPVHAEARVSGDQVTLLEVAARSIGGLCSRALRFRSGMSLEQVILRHALSLSLPPLAAQRRASGVMMLPIPRPGRLVEVRGRAEALAVEGVTGLELTIAPGRQVRPLPEGDRYLGFLFAQGEEPAAVEASLRRGHAHLEVVLDPL
ncbi:MAG: ATP-grasp domain-containing protein [Acidimicrobiia bacterium]